ncbi:hypothetical protein AJ79_08810 [Helicocarpus griseus UAMH5409]|uniref:glucose oxidase n=1 Tax=Helicocarpus griseus UAMH5409 TaxID=1447875 RepID=A0A2B7WPT8_9EURO|nr:hypothetical protein AJ79_08810 [Helicocarpus griseus UAMH5409]
MPPLHTAALLLLGLILQLAWTSPVPIESRELKEEYDYIIVGGGTNGLTVGDRLTADGKSSVLVLEYGYFDNEVAMHPRRMFNITSTPQPELGNRTFFVGLGCVVGGSSSVNGQVFLRGTKQEFDAWAQLGGRRSTWGWKGLLPYFKKGLSFSPPDEEQAKEFNIKYDPEFWGTSANIWGSFGHGNLRGVMKLFYSAMKNMPGMTVPSDSGAGETGLYWYTLSQEPENWQRSYSRTGHLDGLNRENYEIIVGAKVNKVLFHRDVATGVQWVSRNDTELPPQTVRARKEVILAAGTVHTPQILMLSGIGPAPLLKEANIDVKVNLPGVGSNFQDHSYIPSIFYQCKLLLPLGVEPQINVTRNPNGGGGPPSLAAMIGLPTISPENFEALAKKYETQDPREYLPEWYDRTLIEGYRQQQKIYAKLMRSPDVTFNEMMLFGPGGSVQNLHPMSRGSIRINTTNPEGGMIVDYRAATNPIDIDVMVEIIKFMRKYMASPYFEPYEPRELIPGPNVMTDADLATWARANIIPSVFHPIGTCAKMPRKWGGVVDEDLLVYDTRRLSIVDTSVMPIIVGATTSMASYAIAEKAADIILSRRRHGGGGHGGGHWGRDED